MILLLTGCGMSGTVDPGIARGPGPVVGGYRLQLSRYVAAPGDIVTATLVGPSDQSAPSSLQVSVTCGVKDIRVSTIVTGVPVRAPGSPPSRGLPVTAAMPVQFTVPTVTHQACTVARTVDSPTGTVHPGATLDVN
jgi:hypothetical protein